jgi:hypothetical protein
MFENRKIREKLGMGFVAILILTITVAWFGLVGMDLPKSVKE